MINQEFGGKWAGAYADEHDRLLGTRMLTAFPHFLVDKLKGRTQTYPVAMQLEKQISTRHGPTTLPYKSQEMIRTLRTIAGIKESHAHAIYNEFGSIEEILSSPIERLATIRIKRKAFGRKLAEIIFSELEKMYGEYKPAGHRP